MIMTYLTLFMQNQIIRFGLISNQLINKTKNDNNE